MVDTLNRRRLAGTGLAEPHVKYFLDLIDTMITAINLGLGGVLVPVATVAALKAITAAVRTDKVLCLVEDTGLYRFDAQSSATGDDEYVVAPTAGTGRWILVMRAALPRGISDPVADLTALRAVGLTDLADRTIYFCETLGLFYYDASDAQADDGVTVVVPTAIVRPATGSFLLLAPISTAALETKATVASRIVGPLANLAALKALAEAGRSDNTMVLVDGLGIYKFDSGSAAAGDDLNVVVPDAGTGRWLLIFELGYGQRILSQAADLTAAKAMTAAQMLDGAIVLVKTLGLFRVDTSSAATADDVNIIRPTCWGATNGRLHLVAPINLSPYVNQRIVLPLADLTALKAVAAADRSEGTLAFVATLGLFHFDADGAGTNDDKYTVAPDAGTGRWILDAELGTGTVRLLAHVADLTAAKAIAEVNLKAGALVLVDSLGFYGVNPTSAAAGDDVDVIRPTCWAATDGRLHRIAPIAGGLWYTQGKAALAPTLAADHLHLVHNGTPNADKLFVDAALGAFVYANAVGGGLVPSHDAVNFLVVNVGSGHGVQVYRKTTTLVADLTGITGGVNGYMVSQDGRVVVITHDVDPSTGGDEVCVNAAGNGIEGNLTGAADVDIPLSTTLRGPVATLPTIA